MLTFQALRDWHAKKSLAVDGKDKIIHQEAVKLLNSLCEAPEHESEASPFIGRDELNIQLQALMRG